MAIQYQIVLHSRSGTGFDTFGEFFIGNDRQVATELFGALAGSADNLQDGLLLMELREIRRDLPFDMRMIHCTLDQVTENCRLIVKNQFRALNFKET